MIFPKLFHRNLLENIYLRNTVENFNPSVTGSEFPLISLQEAYLHLLRMRRVGWPVALWVISFAALLRLLGSLRTLGWEDTIKCDSWKLRRTKTVCRAICARHPTCQTVDSPTLESTLWLFWFLLFIMSEAKNKQKFHGEAASHVKACQDCNRTAFRSVFTQEAGLYALFTQIIDKEPFFLQWIMVLCISTEHLRICKNLSISILFISPFILRRALGH